MKRCLPWIAIVFSLVIVLACKGRSKTKQDPLYIDFVKETSNGKDSVVFHDNMSGKDVKLRVLTEEELEQKRKEFNDKYPDML